METQFLKRLGLGQLRALRESLAAVGGEALNMVAPDNFEYYRCAFELRDDNDNMVAYLLFDVLPNNIAEQKQPIISNVKTIGGFYTVVNDSFNPFNISIQGTFGRKLRLLTNSKEINTEVGFRKLLSGNVGAFFDSEILIKTGYGAIKMLQKIVECSHREYYHLIFHNYTFNSHYYVNIMGFDFNISTENNFMWFYNVNMTAIGEWYDYRDKKEKVEDLVNNFLKTISNNGITNVLKDVNLHLNTYGLYNKSERNSDLDETPVKGYVGLKQNFKISNRG